MRRAHNRRGLHAPGTAIMLLVGGLCLGRSAASATVEEGERRVARARGPTCQGERRSVWRARAVCLRPCARKRGAAALSAVDDFEALPPKGPSQLDGVEAGSPDEIAYAQLLALSLLLLLLRLMLRRRRPPPDDCKVAICFTRGGAAAVAQPQPTLMSDSDVLHRQGQGR